MRTYRTVRAQRASEPMTVDAVAARVKNLIEYDETLSNVTVEGELTNLIRHTSGHAYFVLKGVKASMNCVMFRDRASGQLLWPRLGDRVLVVGSVRLYEDRGTVQLYAQKLYPMGQSAAARAKEELRLRLEHEGIFSPAHKRNLPPFPRIVACVTSDTGAALRDVMRQHAARYPAAELIVVPCLVQGVHAAESAAEALRRAGALPGADVVLLVRGGGAKEDLNPFDDEELVRAVFACPVPVVTGVGHEIDESLCDLAADVRQPTPTAAAAAVFPDGAAVLSWLDRAEERIAVSAQSHLKKEFEALARNSSRVENAALHSVQDAAQKIDSFDSRLSSRVGSLIVSGAAYLDGLERALGNLSPVRLAQRGYSLVSCDGKPLLSASDAAAGDEIVVQLLDGDVSGRVEAVSKRI